MSRYIQGSQSRCVTVCLLEEACLGPENAFPRRGLNAEALDDLGSIGGKC